MATDPTKLIPPTALNWGAQEQPAQPAPAGPSLDRSTLEAMASGPQVNPLVPPAPVGATDTRKASVEGASSARQERLAGASERRRALLGGDSAAIEREAAAALNGNETDDLRGLSWSEKLRVKEDTTLEMFDIGERENADRSTGEVITDTGVSLGKGIVQGAGSLATLGAAAIDPKLGVAVAEANTDFGKWADGLKSDEITERRRIAGLRNQLDAEDNEKEYQSNLGKGDSEFVAGLKKIGSDFVDSFENYTRDGGLVGELTTEGVGSLASSAGIGGVVAKLTSKGLTKVVSEKLAERAVMGGVIGSMEGGDAYGNAALQVMEMDEKTLQAQSPEYVSLRESGMSHEDAQLELAHNSGMGAAAIAVPAGALGGALVSKFERLPLGMGGAGVRDAVKTTATQFAEESYQEGSSALAANVGLRWSGANPEADLTEGVGESAAMGGIGGAGMGAVISGPKAAVKAPINAAKLIVDISNKRETAKEEAVSPVSNTAVQAAVVKSNEAATRIQEAVKTVAPVENDPTRAQLDALMNIPEAEVNSLSPNLRPALTGKSRTDGLFSLVQALDDDKLTQEEKDEALLYVKFSLPRVGQVVGGDLRDRVEAMSPGMGNDVDIMADTIGRMVSNPKVAKALGMELTPEQIEALTAAEDPQKVVANLAMAAEVAPTMLNPVKAREALNHATNGTFRVNPESIRFLAMAADLGDLIQEHKETLDQTFSEVSSENTNRVRDEAFITGRGKQPSMVQHIDRISNSIRGGQMEQAKAEMEEFRLFAEGQKNKLAAMEASKAKGDGNGVTYGVNTPDGWLPETHERAKSVTYLRGKGAAISELLLQNMRADTKALERAYARVAEAFPEMQVEPSSTKVKEEATFEELDARFEKERDAIRDSGKSPKDWTDIEKAVYDARTNPVIDGDTGERLMDIAEANNRPDLAKYIAERVSRAVNSMVTEPGVSKDNPKYEQIKATLKDRKTSETAKSNSLNKRADALNSKVPESPHPKMSKAEINALNEEMDAQEAKEKDAATRERKRDEIERLPDELISKAASRSPYKGIPPVSKRPFTRVFLRAFGQIDPNGPAGRELKNMGITSKNSPGIFKKGGKTDLDNWPLEEAGDYQFLLQDDGNGYVQQDEIISILVQEAAGEAYLSDEDAQNLKARAEIDEVRTMLEQAGYPAEVKSKTKKKKDKNQLELKLDGVADADEAVDLGSDERDVSPRSAVQKRTESIEEGSEESNRKTGGAQDTTGNDAANESSVSDAVSDEPAADLKSEILTGDNGKPVTFYHATKAEFDEFAPGMTFWSSNKNIAFLFGKGKQGDGKLRIVEAQIQATNPAYVDAGDVAELDVYQNQNAVARDKLLADGHDVIVYFNDQGAALVISTKNSQVIQKKGEDKRQGETGKNFDFSDLDYEWERENLDDMISMMPPDDEVAIRREQKKLDDAFEEEIKRRDAAWDAIGEVSQTMLDILSGELTSEEMNSIVWNKSVANDQKVAFLNNKLPKNKKEKIKELQRDFVIQYRLDNQKQGNALFYDEIFEYLLENKSANNNKKPEVVSEEEPEVTLSDLVPKTNERFRNAYSLRKDGSKLLAQTSPIEAVRNQIMSSNKGGVLNEAWNRLLNLSGKMTQQMNKKLRQDKTAQDFIQKLKAGHVFKSGNTVLDTAAGRSLALLDQETGQFESRIAEVGGLAFVHWLMNERKPDINRLDDTDVAGIFRISPDDVTQAMTNVVASGNYIENAVASLADTITKFAGLAPVNGVSRSDAGGIILGLAAELMDAAIELGLISISNQTVEINRNGKTENWPYRAVIIDNETVQTFQTNMTQSGELSTLEEIIVPDADKAFYIGEPPTKIDPTQMKNRENPLTAKETKAVKNSQNEPSYVNSPIITLMKAMGKDNWLTLMGFEDTSTNRKMNIQHRKSVEGKNTSLVYGWDGVMGHVAAVDRYAAENQMAQDEVPSFWAYGISKVGRLQQRGFGPQADKQAREALTATVATLDLTDPAQDDRFWMTVAQSIGVKTERGFRADVVAKAKKMMSQPLAEEALGILLGLVQSPEGTLSDNESKALLSLFAEMATKESGAGFGPTNPKLVHAFLAVARYWNAKENGTDTAFKHNLALESDGKTDGPINAIMNFLSGEFNVKQLMLMAMGGFFVNRNNKTLNSHFMNGGKDLYEYVAKMVEVRLQTIMDNLPPDGKIMMQAVLGLTTVTGNVVFEDGKIIIGRGVVKNPLTVSVYGAGEAGIAGKVTREVMDAVYERFTKSLTGMDDVQDIVNQLATLVNNKIVYSKKKGKYFVFRADHESPIGKVDAEKFVLNAAQYAQLRDNIKVLFSDPLVDSINEMMGETKKTMSLMQQSTQVQAIIAQERFRNRVAEIKANKKSGEDLSEKEYFEVFKEIAPYGAQIYMPDQSANVGVSEKLGAYNPDPNKRDTDLVRALGNDRVSGNLKTIQPSDAGVKAAPFMVIMTGDAKMILYLAADGLVKTLMVFDGVEMAADMMDEQSYVINKAVALGWSQDSSAAVADSFENFMRQNPLNTPLSLEARQKLARVFGVDRDIIANLDVLYTREDYLELVQRKQDAMLSGQEYAHFDNQIEEIFEKYYAGKDFFGNQFIKLAQRVRNTSDEIRARKEALQEFGYSVDHMASAEQPYSKGANKLLLNDDGTPLDDVILVQRMNEVYTKKLNQIKKDRGERQTKEKPNAGLVSLVQEGAAAVRGKKGGTVSLSISQMFKAVKTAKNSYQRQMLHAGLTALRSSGYMFHFGTREELVKLRETLSPGIDQPLDLGQIDPAGKHGYIASATTETALHEVIHAATIDKVFKALTDPSSVTEAVRQAVDRLNLLMEEFMGYDFKQLNGDKAGIDAQNAINSHLKKGTEAGRAYAINEFMAWTMSNQQLIEVLQKTKVQNPVARLALKVLRTIKGLLGMSTIPDSMFANIRFNTEIILREEMEVESDIQEALNHTVGSDSRLADVMKRFNGLFSHYMNTMAVDPDFTKKAKREFKAKNRTDLEIKVKEVTEIFQSAGFKFSDQQAQAFAAIQKAMMTTVDLHTPSLMRAQALYRHVLTNVKPEDFMENPLSTNPNDIKLGQDKFNAFTGAYGFRRDIMGRSSLLGSFIALSQVDPQFREMLSKIKPPKGDGASPQASSRFDEIVTGAFNNMSETVASMMYDGAMRKTSVGQTLDNLAISLTVIKQDSQTKVEKAYDTTMNKAEQKLVKLIQSGVDGGIELLDKARSKSKNQVTNAMVNVAQSILAMGSERHAQAYADEKTSLFNSEKTPNFIRDLFAEMRGTHSTNENLHNMVGKVKYEVSGNRQDYLEVLPHTILNKFKKKMVPAQWYSLSRAIANTDLGNLLGRYSLNRVEELLSDGRKLNGEIASLRARLAKAAPMHAAAYETKANALATYMVTGEVTSKNLLTNAIAISRLLGERSRPSQVPAQEIVDMIDDLTSLMALQKTQKTDRDVLLDKIQNEREGMDFMLRYLHELDRREKSKTTNMRGLFNHVKGQVDTVSTGSDKIIVADDTEFKKLTRMGYVRMGDYNGDKNDPGLRGYYYSSVTGQSTYHQGVMQTVQQTVYGVDAMTGYMVGNGGGRIHGAAAKRIKADLFKQKKDNLPPGEYLKPVYDEAGNAVAFERMLAPAMLAKAKKDDHLATRIGTWRGRQAEEAHSTQYNTELVKVLKDYWEDQKFDHADEFVDLADPKQRDRVTDHIWTVIPKEMKQEIEYAFGMTEEGKPRFMVRRDMLNDALGYPGASIGDVFTGNNRIPQSVNEASRKFLTAAMGTRAYPWLIQTEQLWQSAVSAAKTTMVIRSVVIPLANIVSNAFQLLLRRVPLRYFGKPLMHKVAETNTFLRNKVRLAELEAEGIAARGDIQRTAALRAKYRAIEDENKRLSIWPLIERGEFATISDGLSEADKVVDNSKIMDMIEAQVNKLPEGVRTLGKYAIVSRDTALFKLLNRSVQYGDFIAKALLYEHNLAQGLDPEDAYRAIRNEFVNYNLLPGRLRTALEGMGLLWFYNFKIRSMKTALSVIRNNPLSALLWSLSPVRDIPINGFGDSVLTDNLIVKGFLDKLHHTMGPGMVTMIYESNPWIRFMNS